MSSSLIVTERLTLSALLASEPSQLDDFLLKDRLVHNVTLSTISRIRAEPTLKFSALLFRVNSHIEGYKLNEIVALSIVYDFHGSIFYSLTISPALHGNVAASSVYKSVAVAVAQDILHSEFKITQLAISDNKIAPIVVSDINLLSQFAFTAGVFMDLNLFELSPKNLRREYATVPNGFIFGCAELKDVETVADFNISFVKELNLGEDTDRLRTIERSRDLIEKNQRYLIKQGSEAACYAGIRSVLPKVFSVGPVYTPPKYRKLGLATCITANICKELFDSGRAEVLSIFADSSNLTTNHIYPLVGFTLRCTSSTVHLHAKS